MSAITEIRISDPRKKRLVATAVDGEYMETGNFPKHILVYDAQNERGMSVPEHFKYSIAFKLAGRTTTVMNMSLDHTQTIPHGGGMIYAFYEVV